MPLAGLLTQPGVVERWGPGGSTDQYGNEAPTKVSEYATTGYLEQTDATEIAVDRETFVSNWLLVLAAGSAIDGGDRWRDSTGTYEVIGRPARPWNPRTRREDHVEARLRQVTG